MDLPEHEPGEAEEEEDSGCRRGTPHRGRLFQTAIDVVDVVFESSGAAWCTTPPPARLRLPSRIFHLLQESLKTYRIIKFNNNKNN